jgi:Na+:H+ antiporter, NhaA family
MIKRIDLFKSFFQSEKTGGFLLIGCTIISLIIANTSIGNNYSGFWHSYVDLSFWKVELNYSVEHWINDGLMAVFFLLVGLEIERELYVGELSSFKNALLPIIAAAAGMFFPALIHFVLNQGSITQSGFGIPMATDIAFALSILSLSGKRIPVSVKIFLTALAIIDDLGAIIIIAIFYTKDFSPYYFIAAIAIFFLLFIAGKKKIYNLLFYLAGGVIMWYCMLKSGVHATIAGVLLAFAIPFNKEDEQNSSYKLQHLLHYPVAFIVLPLFALANTAIIIPSSVYKGFTSDNSLGIILGLVLGKFAGIFFISFLAVKAEWATLSPDLNWTHIAGIALLAGIGFTMSMFITNLAFDDQEIIIASKMSILFASFCAAILGFLILKRTGK